MDRERLNVIKPKQGEVKKALDPIVDKLSDELALERDEVAALAINALSEGYFPHASGPNTGVIVFEVEEGKKVGATVRGLTDARGNPTEDSRYVAVTVPGRVTFFDEPEHAIYLSGDQDSSQPASASDDDTKMEEMFGLPLGSGSLARRFIADLEDDTEFEENDDF